MKKRASTKGRADLGPNGFIAMRHRLGLTQIELAKALGVSRRTLQHWETGDRRIPPMAAILLERLLRDHETVNEMSEKISS